MENVVRSDAIRRSNEQDPRRTSKQHGRRTGGRTGEHRPCGAGRQIAQSSRHRDALRERDGDHRRICSVLLSKTADAHQLIKGQHASAPDLTSTSLGSLDHPAKFVVQDRVLDDRFRLSGFAPAMLQHRHREVRVGSHHPHNALIGPHAFTCRACRTDYRCARWLFGWLAVPIPSGAADADGFPWFALSHNCAMVAQM
jgi:hypothetical protein